MVPIVKQVKGMALPESHIFWEHFLEDNQLCWAHPAMRGPIKIKDVCSVNLFFWTPVLVPSSYFPLEFLCEFISRLLCPCCWWHWAVRQELSCLALGKPQALVALHLAVVPQLAALACQPCHGVSFQVLCWKEQPDLLCGDCSSKATCTLTLLAMPAVPAKAMGNRVLLQSSSGAY